jgi:hypothetical protein
LIKLDDVCLAKLNTINLSMTRRIFEETSLQDDLHQINESSHSQQHSASKLLSLLNDGNYWLKKKLRRLPKKPSTVEISPVISRPSSGRNTGSRHNDRKRYFRSFNCGITLGVGYLDQTLKFISCIEILTHYHTTLREFFELRCRY